MCWSSNTSPVIASPRSKALGQLVRSCCMRPWGLERRLRTAGSLRPISAHAKQYSSGGKRTWWGYRSVLPIKRLRAVLIQGARAYINHIKEPKTTKDQWLSAVVQRAGYGKASVALANKNVRTAWAILTQGTVYHKTRLAGLVPA